MANEETLRSISREASADLSAKQYHFMTINASGLLAAAGAGVSIDGILQDKPDAANRAGQLGVRGRSKIVVGAAVTAGDDLTPDAAGKAVTAATGDVIAGTALEDGAASGNIVSILLNPQREPVA